MRAAREIHAQRAETADEVLVQLDSIATRDTSALAQLERAGARLLASGSLTPALQAYLKKQQGLVQQELATRRVLARRWWAQAQIGRARHHVWRERQRATCGGRARQT